MTNHSQDDAFDRWQQAMLDALRDRDAVMAWQDRRYSFTYQVGELLAGPAAAGGAPLTGPVLYGVTVDGAGLLYIGQTREAQRRLRDLVVGESHHLAMTVPPETWERVVVIEWPLLLAEVSRGQALAAQDTTTCGLALEYLLQLTFLPVMAERRRSRSGGWVSRRMDASQSRGARHSQEFRELFGVVRDAWDELAATVSPPDGQAACYTARGRVVFPRLLQASGHRGGGEGG